MNIDAILAGLSEKAAGVPALGNSLKFALGDHTIYIDGTGSENVVSTENKEADCTISMKPEDFSALISGDLNPMGAFMSGKIKVDGNMGVAMKLQGLLG